MKALKAIWDSKRLISGLKVIWKALTQDRFLKVATAQYFGYLYYELSVSLGPLLVKHKKKLEVLHYKILRVAARDRFQIYPRDMLDTLGRAKPQTPLHTTWLALLSSTLLGKPERLLNLIYYNAYSARRIGKLRFYDSSYLKVGKQSILKPIDDTTIKRWW